MCGECKVEMLFFVCKFWCCFEIIEATWKYSCEGLDVGCIVNHSDFGPLAHRSVFLLAGLLQRKSKGKQCKKRSETGCAGNRFDFCVDVNTNSNFYTPMAVTNFYICLVDFYEQFHIAGWHGGCSVLWVGQTPDPRRHVFTTMLEEIPHC